MKKDVDSIIVFTVLFGLCIYEIYFLAAYPDFNTTHPIIFWILIFPYSFVLFMGAGMLIFVPLYWYKKLKQKKFVDIVNYLKVTPSVNDIKISIFKICLALKKGVIIIMVWIYVNVLIISIIGSIVSGLAWCFFWFMKTVSNTQSYYDMVGKCSFWGVIFVCFIVVAVVFWVVGRVFEDSIKNRKLFKNIK